MVEELVERFGHVYQLPSDRGIISQFLEYNPKQPQENRVLLAAKSADVIWQMFYELAQSKMSLESKAGENALVTRAKQHIAERIREDTNLNDISVELDVSPEHLIRVFRIETGNTPYQYIKQQKTLAACHLLKETDWPLKRVAAHLGYSSPSQFARAFRAMTKMSPREFRKVGHIPLLFS